MAMVEEDASINDLGEESGLGIELWLLLQLEDFSQDG